MRDLLERFPELDPSEAKALIHDVVEEFFCHVMDLGASESYHHAASWGLARHSLEVAAYASRLARSRHFVGHAAPNPEEQEHRLPRLRYACFLFALYHDIGKILQSKIVGPGREAHNPFVEALSAFYDRHGRTHCRVEWRAGRGLEDHVELTPYLVGRVLPRAAATYIGPSVLAEVIERKTPGAVELHEIIQEADEHSVREDRRKAEAKAASVALSPYAPGSFVAYLGKSFAEGLRQGELSVNVFGGDVLLGRRFAFFTYPEAVLKIVSLVRRCFSGTDVGARMLTEDESGARFFLAKLKVDDGIFTDPLTGLWKLKATIRHGDASEVREGVLIPLLHLALRTATPSVFEGGITLHRVTDNSKVVIDDFQPPPLPPPPQPVPEPAKPPEAPAAPRPALSPPMTVTPAPHEGGIDPEELVRSLLEGILSGWISTNMPLAHVYVSPKATFVVTPAVFLEMRKRGLYPDFDPQEQGSAFLRALGRLDFVQKSTTHRVVYPILLSPRSPRPLKVIKFDTLGLFKTEEVRTRVGLWKEWEEIIELPQAWRPGDAVVGAEESDD